MRWILCGYFIEVAQFIESKRLDSFYRRPARHHLKLAFLVSKRAMSVEAFVTSSVWLQAKWKSIAELFNQETAQTP